MSHSAGAAYPVSSLGRSELQQRPPRAGVQAGGDPRIGRPQGHTAPRMQRGSPLQGVAATPRGKGAEPTEQAGGKQQPPPLRVRRRLSPCTRRLEGALPGLGAG